MNDKLIIINIDDKQQITVTLPSDGYYKTISLSDKWTQYVVSNVLGSNVDNNNVEEVVLSNKFVLIRLKDSDDNNLYKVEPNFHLLNRLDDRKDIKNGIIITQKADLQKDGIHFYSRVFLPWIGVNEDPVCGSAHTLLTPYWCQKLGLSGQQLIAKQCSQRSGIVGCRLNGNGIQLSASAVIVLKGQIFI
ncbi:phenazine biosynthesis-like domain-containing protein [Oppia nitens]|uniref:phenazine biosynthesis-like domain-containing protein n=1 Tax=Oppia nitens TaxID=1686743 RepID=UPI0023DCB225|nr:phenazine biosynthesis-like domain-containing protein [Oppia nitens]